MKSKEQRLFDEGMEMALSTVKSFGVEELEKEVRYRNSHIVRPTLTRAAAYELLQKHLPEELENITTASAKAIRDLGFPPSMIKAFLDKLATNCDNYRYNPEERAKDARELNLDLGFLKATEEYNAEVEKAYKRKMGL